MSWRGTINNDQHVCWNMQSLSDLGEKAVVASLLSKIKGSAAVGPGDDAAAIDMGDRYLVATTDIISRTAHLPKGMTAHQIGWFVAAVNFSDIAAMGARPIGLLLSFCLPRDLHIAELEDIMRGAQDCAATVDSEIIGGDTKEGREMVISGTALGEVAKDRILLRKGARKGDLLAVTGTMGLAAAGYAAYMQKVSAPAAIRALLEPRPRIREGLILSTSGAATSAMDVTDGLAYSVHELSRQSGIYFKIEWGNIPVDPQVHAVAERTGERVEDMVLHYGGDYELLFTLRPDMLERIQEELGDDFTIIGRAEGRENVLIKDGKVLPLEPHGYEHFR